LAQLRQGQFASALSQARISYNQLQKDRERQEALYTDGMVAETQIEKLRNAVEQPKAGLVMAEENLALSRITAPFSGYIATKRGETGESFSPMGGPPIITLIDYSTVKLKIGVAEKDLGKVKKGQKTTFKVTAYPEKEFTGKVNRISMALHPMNRTAEVEIIASNPGRVLKSGMMASVQVLLGMRKNVLVVPDNIVRREMGITTLYVANGLQAQLTNVMVGVTHNEYVEIIEGLTEQDSIIIDGHLMVKDGNPLQITKIKNE
jgi:membrane fusion protein (multidrug efflux system)